MKLRVWEAKIKFQGSQAVVRRFRANEIYVGSLPRCEVKIPQPAPKVICIIKRVWDEEEKRLQVVLDSKVEELEIFHEGKWQKTQKFVSKDLPRLRFKEAEISIEDISDQRKSSRFEPEEWAASAARFEENSYALWHIKNGVLVESVTFKKGQDFVPLKCGYKVSWSEENPFKMSLVEYDGIPQGIEATRGRSGHSFRAPFKDNVFVITRVPEKKALNEIPIDRLVSQEPDRFRRTLFAATFTWILMLSLLQMVPKPDFEEEITLEEIPESVAKIILEPVRIRDGGDQSVGGGGNEFVAKKDKRGGSGLESKLIKESSGADEVLVRNKGALKALNQAEKVLGTGVLKALEAGGAIASALGKLDEGLNSGKIKAAGIPSVGRTGGKGSAKGVIGALSAIGGSGPGGGGVGIGGVGTKGFGGGSGGAKGSGFGTGVGKGLGNGSGNRQIAFDSERLDVRGGLERSEVEAVIQENLSQIRLCYNRGLRSNPLLQGKVLSSFKIGADGSVVVSRVKNSTLASRIVENCIAERISSWRFPEPRGGGEVAVNYPFLLKAK